MGNVSSVLLGVGNRPRQGRAVLEILFLLWLLRKIPGRIKEEEVKNRVERRRQPHCQQQQQQQHHQDHSSTNQQNVENDEVKHASDGANGSSAISNGIISRHSSGDSSRNCSRRPSNSSSTPSSSSAVSASTSSSSSSSSFFSSWLVRANTYLRSFEPLQLVMSMLLLVHIFNNLSLLLGLNAPHHSMTQEPDMHYSASFARIRWLLTSLDAATLSTLKVRWPPLRHALMVALSVYYLIFFRRAENKVDAFRRSMTHESVRSCWEKGTTPVLAFIDRLARKRCQMDLVPLKIRSPDGHDIECKIFFDGSAEELANQSKLVLDLPGGGFIAMSPEHHADYLSHWARLLKVPILSVNYRKAPRFPYPCGFEDVWYVYKSLIDSNGSVMGINKTNPSTPLRIVLVGDSAGGNLSAGVTIKSLLSGVRAPDGLALIYPVLDFCGEIWQADTLTPRNVRVRAREWKPPRRRRNKLASRSASPPPPPSAAPKQAVASSPAASMHNNADPLFSAEPQRHRPDDSGRTVEEAQSQVDPSAISPNRSTLIQHPPSASSFSTALTGTNGAKSASTSTSSVVASPHRDMFGVPQLSSRTLYFQDGVLPMKYMLLLADSYFKNGGDPVNDPFASPMAASDAVLARFPPLYAHVGSVDPLVDDVRKFARRVALANPANECQVCVIPKVSHAYMHVVNFLPEAIIAQDLTARWLAHMLQLPFDPVPQLDERLKKAGMEVTDVAAFVRQRLKERQRGQNSSDDDDDQDAEKPHPGDQKTATSVEKRSVDAPDTVEAMPLALRASMSTSGPGMLASKL